MLDRALIVERNLADWFNRQGVRVANRNGVDGDPKIHVADWPEGPGEDVSLAELAKAIEDGEIA